MNIPDESTVAVGGRRTELHPEEHRPVFQLQEVLKVPHFSEANVASISESKSRPSNKPA
jgi:hypothetical protein